MAFRERTIYGGVEQWRIGDRGAENCWPGTFAKDNAAVNGSGTVTPYGRVVAGTVVAMGPDGYLHPCGLAELSSAVSTDNDVVVDPQATKNFYVGDEVAVVSRATSRGIAITGEADDDVLTAATDPNLKVGDQVAVSGLTGGTGAMAGTYVVSDVLTAPLVVDVVGEADDETFTSSAAHGLSVGDQVTLFAGAGGTGIDSGIFYVKTVPSATTFTLSATPGGSTAAFSSDITVGSVSTTKYRFKLTGFAFTADITAGTLTVGLGEPQYTNITGTRHVSARDLSDGTITLDGATFSAAAGDLLVKVNAYKPHGILADHVVTQRYVYDVLETEDKLVSVALQGDGRMRQCPGITPTSTGVGGYENATTLMRIMKGAPYADPMTGASVTPKFAEFTFRDV